MKASIAGIATVLTAGIGVAAARMYYRWLSTSGVLNSALSGGSQALYWALMSVPVLVVATALFTVLSHFWPKVRIAAVAAAVFGALVIAWLGLLGDWLLCVFITHGSCD
jgi:uncharacterized BrkB/YihY/UPF0761 family membrane protein